MKTIKLEKMKHEWRKHEKTYYLPKTKPELVKVPPFQFITLKGEGNPNSSLFSECISTLYSLAYPIKMNLKKDPNPPKDCTDFTVYPLEGIWDINDTAKQNYNGTLNKDDLVFKIMIRQPDFVKADYFYEQLSTIRQKKDNPLLETVAFETIEDGLCVQMLHIGSYDDEPASFAKMETFAKNNGLERIGKDHREIYLSDFRKVAPEKLKTTLRFWVKKTNE